MVNYLPPNPNIHNPDQVSAIHEALIYIDVPFDTKSPDYIKREYGDYTREVVSKFEIENGLKYSNKGEFHEISANLINANIYNKRNETPEKTIELFQILRKIGFNVSRKVLSKGEIDLPMVETIRAFQNRMFLTPMGFPDKKTEKLLYHFNQNSFPEYLQYKPTSKLKRVTHNLDFSSTGTQVRRLHKSLAALGYLIEIPEYNTLYYGKSTIEAVKMLQRSTGIGIDGRLNTRTAVALAKTLDEKIPGIIEQKTTYRVRGSIRGEKFEPIKCFVELYSNRFLEKPVFLDKRETFKDGFFDIIYTPYLNDNGEVDPKNNSLTVKVKDLNDKMITEEIIHNPRPVHYFNFTINQSREIYLGKSLYRILTGKLLFIRDFQGEGLKWFTELREDKSEGLSNLSNKIGIEINTIMKLFFAFRISNRIIENYPDIKSRHDISPTIAFALLYAGNTILPDNILPDVGDNWDEWLKNMEEILIRNLSLLKTDSLLTILEGAVRNHIIDITYESLIPGLVEKTIPELGNHVILSQPLNIGNVATLDSVFDFSGVDKKSKVPLAQIFITNQGFTEIFWKQAQEILPSSTYSKLQLNTEYGSLVDFENHNTNIITQKLAGSSLDGAYKIAELSVENWKDIIIKEKMHIPSYPEEENQESPLDRFANDLYLKTTLRYPSLSFVSHIEESSSTGLPNLKEIKNLLKPRPRFNFIAQELDPFFQEISAGEELKEQILLVQRVQNYTIDGSQGNILLKNKFHSSAQIVNYRRDAFLSKMMEEGISKDTAKDIFRQAEYNYAKLLSFFSEFSPQTNQINPAVLQTQVLQSPQNQVNFMRSFSASTIPNLENLFGSFDSCSCSECQSVVGASAYLVDIIRFLQSRIAKPSIPESTETVKDVLLRRRPDLDYIELSCTNTDTPIPYIDIVCEVLENAVVSVAGSLPPPQVAYDHQTRLSARELRAFPEYLNKDAYNYLLEQIYPLHSPVFNLWQENTRLYLTHLGSPWWSFMQIWQNQQSLSPRPRKIAAEYFEFSSLEESIIDNSYLNTHTLEEMLSDMWNIDFSNTVPDYVSVDWFLEKTKLSYDQLLLLLQTDYINITPPADRIKIVYPLDEENTDPCNTATQQIVNLSLNRFNRIQRFLRLWHHSSWSMWELDILLKNTVIAPLVNNDSINTVSIVNLMKFSEIQKQLKLTAEELLTFWGNINIKNYRTTDKEINSLYKRLFLNLSFVNPIAGDYNALAYDPGITPVPPTFTEERIKLLSASLSYPEVEIRKILAYYDDPVSGNPENASFSLEAIAFTYRYATLLKKLKISFADFITYITISGNELPFAGISNVEKTLTDIQFMRSINKNFSIWEYILSGSNDNKNSLKPDAVLRLMQELRISISTANAELEDASNPERSNVEQATLLFQRLPQFQNLTQIQLAIDFVEGRSISNPPQYPDSVSPENIREIFFNEFFASFIPKSEWSNALNTQFAQSPTPLPELEIETRYNYLFSYLKSFALQLSFSQILSRQLNIDLDKLDILLQDIQIPTTLGPDSSIIAVLFALNPDLIAKNPEGAYVYPLTDNRFDSLRVIYPLLHKIVAVLKLLPEFSSQELYKYIDYQQQLDENYPAGNPLLTGITNLSQLPLIPTDPISSYERLVNWIRLEQIRTKFDDRTEEFFELLNDAITLNLIPTVEIASLLAAILDETADTIHTIIVQLGIQKLQFSDAFIWKRVLDCLNNYHTIEVDVTTLISWLNKNNNPITGETISNDVVKASKAKYSLDTWLTVVEPFQDTLREKKRNALVSFLIEYSIRNNYPTVPYPAPAPPDPVYINTDYWATSDDLYAYFLLDVEMSPCQLTSRIRQASLSVQVFVQRCFLGLEKLNVEIPNINADPDDLNNWNQWHWMKYYRIWDASRRIFLYPENWIEPDLRPDMSPFFVELTEELSQSDVTDEKAEAVLNNYLDKIQEVANLDIASVFHEKESGIDIFHVVGKTKANPFNYYYRTYNQITRLWSAWDKISADITGSHPLLTKYNGKVYLFWLLFEEKADKVKKVPAAQLTNAPKDAPEAPKIFEIRLGWIRRTRDGWSEKKLSQEKMIHPWGRPKYSYNLRPRLKQVDNTLWIDLYITTSAEFNQPTRFYNQNTGTFNYIAKAQFDERFRPWHSSSFVFNGAVKELRLRKMYGNFLTFSGSNSYDYVNKNFEDAGRAIKQLSSDIQPKIKVPWGMHFEYTYLTNNTRQNINTNTFRTLEGNGEKLLLESAKPPFKQAVSLQDAQWNNSTIRPFFYQDSMRSFFVRPHFVHELPTDTDGLSVIMDRYFYDFNNFYHPYAQVFIQELNKGGLKGLYNRRLQTEPESTDFYPGNNFEFNPTYHPNSDIVNVMENAQKDIVDFSYDGAYSIYNWELFFHVPFYIANKLSQNQRFEEAMKWYQYIFDPTSSDNYSEPKRFWITKPFFEMTNSDYTESRINNILSNISLYGGQVAAWRNDPHNPHLVALGRPVAYQKAIVMKFIDNLLAWGDYLFRADTMETVHEAATLYLLAYQILGKKPEKVPGIEGQHITLKEIFDPNSGISLDIFGGASVELENYLIDYTGSSTYENPELPIVYTNTVPNLMLQYFCIPGNPKLTSYWALVEDRLFKLRHCMNIDGVVRQLPLFEPPIDPALLVRARAQGLSISSVLFNMNTPSPNYRFRTILQKAMEYCGEVKNLGERLLSIIERLDAENLAVLRSTHEINLMNMLTQAKELQIDEADENISNLEKALEITEAKLEYYRNIPKINQEEQIADTLLIASANMDLASGVISTIAGTMHLIPTVTLGGAGSMGSPVATTEVISGPRIGSSMNTAAQVLQIASGVARTRGGMLQTKGGYTRRDEENKFQAQQAEREIEQINIQLTAAEIRKQLAENDLRDHTTRIEYSQAELDFMKNKFSNAALYNWMVSQISATYFQTYQFAHDMALKAEACYKFELGVQNTSFIDYGYWDNLRKGLLAGDKLGQSLRRLEASYYDQNKRELEITKHISLAQYFPTEFTQLKATGSCNIDLPEWIYDLDYPGHYKRRIKSVSITAPCVTGPYTSVNCKLSMTYSKIRSTKDRPEDDDNWYREYTSQNHIVTSNAQGDSGMFQLNLGDERFLPFEGAGAVSNWEILLPTDTNQFDFATLSDFIIHIQYTSLEGGEAAKQAAIEYLEEHIWSESILLLNLRQMFAAEWYKILAPENTGSNKMELNISNELFPYFFRNKDLKFTEFDLYLETDQSSVQIVMDTPEGSPPVGVSWVTMPEEGLLKHYRLGDNDTPISLPGDDDKGLWKLKITSGGNPLNASQLKNAYLIINFKKN